MKNCHEGLTPSTQLFHVVERTKTTAKCVGDRKLRYISKHFNLIDRKEECLLIVQYVCHERKNVGKKLYQTQMARMCKRM